MSTEIKPFQVHGTKKIVSTTHYPFYTVLNLVIDGKDFGGRDFPLRVAFSPTGDYIGAPSMAKRLVEKFGIQLFKRTAEDHQVCSAGYAPSSGKWFGWSHRGIRGFGKGSTFEGKTAETRAEAYQFASQFAESVS